MKGGNWAKCLETIDGIFTKGKFYSVSYRCDPHITLIDDFGNGIGFVLEEDQEFRDHFKLIESQKRGTSWATQRQQ